MTEQAKSVNPLIADLDQEAIREVLRRNYIGSLAFMAHKAPYVLPVTYYYDEASNSLLSYSMEGHKIASIREHPAVAVGVYEMDTPVTWRSVLVHGRFKELSQIDAKSGLHRFTEGIRALLKQEGVEGEQFIRDFSSKAMGVGTPLVYRIVIDTWSGKYRKN